MLTLYTMPGTCSLATNIAVAWLDAPVKIHNLAYGDHKKPEYKAVNDKAKVPALKFDDGDVLTELPAIMSHLGAVYGDGKYARDTKLGRKEDEALCWMSSEVHSAYGGHFAPQRLADGDEAQEAVKAKAYETLDGQYRRLGETLSEAGGEWYLGERSFADAFLYVLTRWIEQTPLKIEDYPALKTFRERMERDEGVKTALARQDMEPIG